MNPLDFPVQNDPEGKSPDPEEQDPQGEGQTLEGGDTPSDDVSDPNTDRLSSLERKVNDLEDEKQQLAIENAVFRTKLKDEVQAESEQKKALSKEELKAFGLENNGSQQADAAFAYTDQVKEQIKEEMRQEYRSTQASQMVKSYMLGIYPQLKNERSRFSRDVNGQQQQIMTELNLDPNSTTDVQTAWNMALHKVGHTTRNTGTSSEEHDRSRRIEESAAEGAPAKSPTKSVSVSQEEKKTLAQYLDTTTDKLTKGQIERFKASQKAYEKRRSIP